MKIGFLLGIIFFLVLHFFLPAQAESGAQKDSLRNTIETLSSFGSRSTGSQGYEKTVDFVKEQLNTLGFAPQTYLYELPIRRFQGAQLRTGDKKISLVPFTNNAITPEATDGTMTAPLFYVGKGRLQDIDGKNIKDSIVLIDFDSGRNWQLLASLGPKRLFFCTTTTVL